MATRAATETSARQGRRGPQELLAAGAVALVAFVAPGEDVGVILRLTFSVLALAVLFLASISLEFYQEAKSKEAEKKVNPFEVTINKVDLPTSPPGGVFEASMHMNEHLRGFPLTIDSDIKPTEAGFQISEGQRRLKARVATGTAIGWELGGDAWGAQRDLWIQAVRAAPRAAAVLERDWMGISSNPPAPEEEAPDPPSAEEAELPKDAGVRVSGLQSKPEHNGKAGVIVKGVSGGRYGVRLEGSKESLSLHGRNLRPLSPFEGLGVSVPCLRSFRAAYASLTSGVTGSVPITSAVDRSPLTPASFSTRMRMA